MVQTKTWLNKIKYLKEQKNNKEKRNTDGNAQSEESRTTKPIKMAQKNIGVFKTVVLKHLFSLEENLAHFQKNARVNKK